jgi:DNA-binding NarL/FixJ family response regulator
MKSIRVVLAADCLMEKTGIRAELNNADGIKVIGEAANGDEVLHLVGELRPDVFVLVVVMPGLVGVEATSLLRESYPNLSILSFSLCEDDECMFGFLPSGIVRYILKEVLGNIVEAIHAASREETRLSKRVQEKVVRRAVGEEGIHLTKRELEVLRLMGQGWTNKRIAKELYITERTVRFHVENILRKLGVGSRTEAVMEGVRRGLVM